MKKQIHGGDIYRNRGVLDFSINVNPLGTPDPVIEAVQKAASGLSNYPDTECEELRGAIGRYEKIRPEHILCTNGAAELFFALAAAVRPKEACLILPAFSEYERSLCLWDTRIRRHILSGENGFAPDARILDQITEDLDLLFLCNPGNPVGQTIGTDLLEQVLEKCRAYKVLVVLDECFIEFLDHPEEQEMTGRIFEFPNLLIVKAFTKIFAMPGLRLGYGICADRMLLQKIKKALQPWNVSAPAQAGGVAALTCRDDYDPARYMEETRAYVGAQRTQIRKELEACGYKVFDSKANYIFFAGEAGLYEQALQAGFLIRDCGGYEGLRPGYYRIAVRTREENERLLTWLKKL